MRREKLLPLVVIAAGLLAYQNSFTGQFIHDDFGSIPENPTIRSLWPFWQTLSPPHRGGLTVESRPLINLSVAINYALGDYHVWGYHALNLTVHVLAGLTMLGIVRRTLLQPSLRARFGAAADELALATAVLWTVHPLQTESVTYIIQRAESIMGLFYLLTLYCFIRGVESVPVQSPIGTRCPASVAAQPREATLPRPTWLTWQRSPTDGAALPSTLWFALSVAACALGMVSKEAMVSAPVMVLLYDRAFLSESFREAWRQRRPLYLALAGTWVLLALVLISGQVPTTLANAQRVGLRWWQYAATEPGVIVYYLRLSLWPHPLNLNYSWPVARTWMSILPPAVAVGVLLGVWAWAWKKCPAWGFVGAWFFLILAPSSSFIPLLDPIYEHRLYLSLAAVISLVVIGLYSLMGRHSLILFAAAAVGLGSLTWQRNKDYQSDPDFSLGMALQRAGRSHEAIAHYEQALHRQPDSADVHNNLGSALLRTGRASEAIAHFERAIALRPDWPDVHYNLAVAFSQTGNGSEAITHFEEALRLKPDYADAHNNLGCALLRVGKVSEAIAHFEQAISLRPEFAEAHYNLAAALNQAGEASAAIPQFEEALRLKPDYAEAQNNLGIALKKSGEISEAIAHYEQAIRLKPDYAEAYNNLGNALAQAGNLPEAIKQWERALQINPDLAEVHFNLGNALSQVGQLEDAIAHYEQALRLNPDFTEARNRLARLRAGR